MSSGLVDFLGALYLAGAAIVIVVASVTSSAKKGQAAIASLVEVSELHAAGLMLAIVLWPLWLVLLVFKGSRR